MAHLVILEQKRQRQVDPGGMGGGRDRWILGAWGERQRQVDPGRIGEAETGGSSGLGHQPA